MAIELNLKHCEHARNGLKLENSRWGGKNPQFLRNCNWRGFNKSTLFLLFHFLCQFSNTPLAAQFGWCTVWYAVSWDNVSHYSTALMITWPDLRPLTAGTRGASDAYFLGCAFTAAVETLASDRWPSYSLADAAWSASVDGGVSLTLHSSVSMLPETINYIVFLNSACPACLIWVY